MMTNATNGFRNIAQRITNAENAFVEYAANVAGLNREDAIKALKVMLKVKAVKIDAVGGQFTFTHGAFADADVIRRAVNS